MKELLNELMSKSSNCVNLGRTIQAHYPELYNNIISKTEFLNSKPQLKFNERVYCVLNDITETQLDSFGEIARFDTIKGGYFLKQHSFNDARNKLLKQQIPKKVKPPKPPKLSKKEKYLKKNAKKYAYLYSDDKVIGVDYVVCPILNVKMPSLTRNYITCVLEMSVEDFDQQYPGARAISTSIIDKTQAALKKVDPITGLTAHQKVVAKMRATLSAVDENGLSGYQKLGQKTRATHMSKVDEFGRNGYSQLASKAIIKGNATKAKKGLILDPSERTEFYRYKLVVTYLTEKHRKSLSEGYVTGLAGTEGAYHIDHIYSIMHGYKNQVSPLVIGNIKNLQMIPWEENTSKHSKSNIKLDNLLMQVGCSLEQSTDEFCKVMKFIEEDVRNNVTVSGIGILEKLYESKLREK